MKIAVYAIAKNEEYNIKDWYESVKDADHILLVDTGSTDNTPEIAKSLNIEVVSAHFEPWNETLAKNLALSLIKKDYDFCINLDLDQRIITDNWKDKILSSQIESNIVQCFSIESLGISKNSIKRKVDLIHSRNNVMWAKYRPVLVDLSNNLKKDLLEIEVENVPGNSERYENRETLYINSFKNYLNILNLYNEEEKLYALMNIALSYFEINDIDNFNKYYNEFSIYLQDLSSNNEKLNFRSPLPISLCAALANPDRSLDIYESIIQNSSDSYDKFSAKLRKSIVFYYKNDKDLIKKELEDMQVDGDGFNFDEYQIQLSQIELDSYKLLIHVCSNEHPIDEQSEVPFLSLMAYTSYGKPNVELAKSIIEHAKKA